ncbi:MAG: FimV family protein [Paracoccaceae bacterium]
MINFLKVILFINFLLISSMSHSEPIVVLEYRGANYQNEYEDDPSNNIFIMDPDHTEKHKVPKGQSLSEIIDDFYAGSGIDKRFLRLAIVTANPKAFAQENPNFMFAGATIHLPSLNQIQAMVLGVPIDRKTSQVKTQVNDRGIFFFGG